MGVRVWLRVRVMARGEPAASNEHIVQHDLWRVRVRVRVRARVRVRVRVRARVRVRPSWPVPA